MNVGQLKKWFLTFVILFVFFNCEYDFSEDSFTNVEQVTPIASLSLNSLRDNQEFYVPTTITFRYNGNNKHLLYEVRVYIDDQLIETSSSSLGSFIIDTESLSDGNHKLKVEYIFSSGSGSLADISGLEAFIKTDEYNFVVDKSIPETVVMKSAEIIDGTIYLSWEPITKMNFDKATLVISNNGDKTYNEITKQELLKLTYNDIYVHKSTCGGTTQNDNNLEYYISLENTRGNSVSNILNLYIPPFEVEKLIVDDNHFKIIIPQHALFKNFDYYLFRDSTNKTYKVSSSGGEIIVEEPIKFPSFNAGVLLTFYKESSGQDISRGCSFSPTSFEKEYDYDASNLYKHFEYNNTDGFTYSIRVYTSCNSCLNGISIDKRNSEDLTIVNSKQIAIVDDYDDEELRIDPLTSNLIIDAGKSTFLIDKNDFSIIKEWSLDEFGEITGEIFYRNNTIVIEQEDEIKFYDSNTKNQLYTATKTDYFSISPSGGYFYLDNDIFQLRNGSVNLISSINSVHAIDLVEFIESSNLCVLNSYQGNPIIFDISNQSSTVLNDFTGINIMDYDITTNNLLLVKNDDTQNGGGKSYAYVYDLESGGSKKIEVQRVSAPSDITHKLRGYWLAKGHLIYLGGYYLNHYINE